MFRMKYDSQQSQHHRTVDARSNPSLNYPSTPHGNGQPNSQDYAWEFGWSFDGKGWLAYSEPQSEQFSSLDKALALAG